MHTALVAQSALLALLALACASTPAPVPVAPVVVPAPADPLAAPAIRPFADAYQKVFCKANYGYDPEATLETLREPIVYMQSLAEGRSDILVGYLQILSVHGFESLGVFTAKAAEIREDPVVWGRLQGRCLDGLEHCQ